MEDWTWLAEQTALMLDRVHREQISVHLDLAPVAHAFIAYCLLQSLPFSDTSLRQRSALASAALQNYARSRKALPKVSPFASVRSPPQPVQTPSFEHAMVAYCCARLGRWKLAQENVSRSIPTHIASRPMALPEIQCLDQYLQVVTDSGRIQDFIGVIEKRIPSITAILHSAKAQDPAHRHLIKLIYKSFNNISDLDGCMENWLTPSDGSDSVPQRHTKMCSLLFEALARTSKDVTRPLVVLQKVAARQIEISGHAVVDLCDRVGRRRWKDGIRTIFHVYMQAGSKPTGSVCRRLMAILSANDLNDEAAELQRFITDQAGATDQTRISMAMIAARKGDIRGAVSNLRHLFNTDITTNISSLETLLVAHINANDVQGVRQVLDHIAKIQSDTRLFDTALRYFANRGDVTNTMEVFDQLLESGGNPSIQTFTALVHLFRKRGDLASLERVVESAIQSGMPLDGPFCAEILDAFIIFGNWIGFATRLAALPSHVRSHPRVASALLKALVLIAAPFEAVERQFRSIQKPTVQDWSLILLSASDHHRPQTARVLLHEMDQRALSDVSEPMPTTYIYSIMLHSYVRSGRPVRARRVFKEMRDRNLIPSSFTYNIMMSTVKPAESARHLISAHKFAMRIFKMAEDGRLQDRGAQLSRTNTNIFGRLIQAAGKLHKPLDAQAYFNLATQDREPTLVLFTQLMGAHRIAGDVDVVLDLWDKVFQRALDRFKPSGDALADAGQSNVLCMPLSIVLDALSANGRYAAVKKVWNSVKDAGFGFDASNFQHYAVALARTGDLYGAFWIIENVVFPQYDLYLKRNNKFWLSDKLRHDPEATPSSERGGEGQDSLRRRLMEKDQADESVFPEVQDLLDYPGPLSPEEMRFARDPLSRPAAQGPEVRRQMVTGRFGRMRKLPLDGGQSAREILETWRPADRFWKPSLMTQMVLSNVYGQVQARRKQVDEVTGRIPVPVVSQPKSSNSLLEPEEEDPDEARSKAERAAALKAKYSKPHIVTLPMFANNPVRDLNGDPMVTTPRAILWRLNRLFPRTVLLLTRYRATREPRTHKEGKAALRRDYENERWRHQAIMERYAKIKARRIRKFKLRSELRRHEEFGALHAARKIMLRKPLSAIDRDLPHRLATPLLPEVQLNGQEPLQEDRVRPSRSPREKLSDRPLNLRLGEAKLQSTRARLRQHREATREARKQALERHRQMRLAEMKRKERKRLIASQERAKHRKKRPSKPRAKSNLPRREVEVQAPLSEEEIKEARKADEALTMHQRLTRELPARFARPIPEGRRDRKREHQLPPNMPSPRGHASNDSPPSGPSPDGPAPGESSPSGTSSNVFSSSVSRNQR